MVFCDTCRARSSKHEARNFVSFALCVYSALLMVMIPCSTGIEQCEDMKRFLWDNHFAAIASDQPALEVRLMAFR